MKILSIDIGIKNLSFCILEINEDLTIKICNWENINISSEFDIKKEKNELFENIPIVLDKYSYLLDVNEIIIENQPSLKNPIMKSIQIIIYTYFLIKGFHNNDSSINKIIFYSANNKLKIYDGPKIECKLKNKYSQSKFLGKEYAKYFLNNNKEKLDYLLNNKKKDDLADCFLQGLSYLKYVKKNNIETIL